MYRQIAEDLRQQIESGEFQPGQMLPPEIELRERYNASRNTIRDALRLLATRGLVDARAGQGTFVSPKIDPFVTTLSWEESVRFASEAGDAGRAFSASAPKVEVQRPSAGLAGMLRLPSDSEVVSRRRLLSIDGALWCLQTSYYPIDLVNQGARRLLTPDEFVEGSLTYLSEVCGIEQVGYRDRIGVAPPSKEEAEIFRLPDDGRVAVMTVLRTGYAKAGHSLFPFRVTITAYPADRNQLVMCMGEVPEPGLDELGSYGDVQMS